MHCFCSLISVQIFSIFFFLFNFSIFWNKENNNKRIHDKRQREKSDKMHTQLYRRTHDLRFSFFTTKRKWIMRAWKRKKEWKKASKSIRKKYSLIEARINPCVHHLFPYFYGFFSLRFFSVNTKCTHDNDSQKRYEWKNVHVSTHWHFLHSLNIWKIHNEINSFAHWMRNDAAQEI